MSDQTLSVRRAMDLSALDEAELMEMALVVGLALYDRVGVARSVAAFLGIAEGIVAHETKEKVK